MSALKGADSGKATSCCSIHCGVSTMDVEGHPVGYFNSVFELRCSLTRVYLLGRRHTGAWISMRGRIKLFTIPVDLGNAAKYNIHVGSDHIVSCRGVCNRDKPRQTIHALQIHM